MHSTTKTLCALLLCSVAIPAIAQEAGQEGTRDDPDNVRRDRLTRTDASQVFDLGQITVYAPQDQGGIGGQTVSQSVVTADDARETNRNTLDEAVRNVPGVSVANTGGSRNERLIFVRGFDRFQVPLYIDGVRIYLPADNRLDYGRFLTPDLSEIQIQKGYASVLSGPGGMGGAINLVTRKPTKELEGELRTGVDVGNTGDLAAFTTFGSIGTRQDMFYLQATGSYRSSDGFFLSRSFDPTPIENGGRRDFSDVEDWRLNFKAGFTPNETDEYVISYTRQEGEKRAPYSVFEPVRGITPEPLPPGQSFQRDWRWPYWDVSSLAFNSNTALGDASYVKTKAYYNTFENLLSAYDDSNFNSQTVGRAFDSYYDDHAYGISVEAGTELIPMNTLKGAVHYRRDVHTEWNHSRPDVSAFVEPKQERSEDTWSLALEDTFHATDRFDIVAGASYDRNKLNKAERYDDGIGSIVDYPLGGSSAFNWQVAGIYRPDDLTELYASISSRTRFPTLFERYSTRFGDALPNPDLEPERAINYEIGASRYLSDKLRVGGAVFYSDIQDVIQSISIGGGLVQNHNVGDGEYYGGELFAEWDALPTLSIGANYTYLKRRLVDPVRPGLRPTGTPEHHAYIYASWNPIEKLTVTPSIELSSARWSTDRLEENFFETDGFALVNIGFEYRFSENFSANFGVQNLLDEDYEYAYGYPEAGRTFYLSSRLVF